MSISKFAAPVTELMQHSSIGVVLAFVVILSGLAMAFWIQMIKLRNKQSNHVQARKTDDDVRREIALGTRDATVLGQHVEPAPIPGRTSRQGQYHHRAGQPPDVGVERSGPLPLVDQVAAVPVRGPVERGGGWDDYVRKAKNQDLVRRSSGNRTDDPVNR